MSNLEEDNLYPDNENFNSQSDSDSESEQDLNLSSNDNNQDDYQYLDFNFEKDQKVYWNEEQEKAVSQYLWMDETWLLNNIKWEKENAEIEGREPDEEKMEHFRQLAQQVKEPSIQEEKNKLFDQKIRGPLIKLVENIVFNFNLQREDISLKDQQNDAISFVMTKFTNFRSSKRKKAYSYYGTVTKNYLIGLKKDRYKGQKTNLDFEDHQEEANKRNKYEIDEESPLEESAQLFNYVVDEIKSELEKTNISENDRKVGDAIVAIFENHENIGLYSKNVLYQIIKERTGLQTKDITYSLSRFKVLYRITKQNFLKKKGKK